MDNKLPISEKLLTAVIGVVVVALVSLIPALEPLQESLGEIVAIIAAAILGQAGVEIQRIHKGQK